MDFVIIANAWSAAHDNPTSKHQIALQLVEQGHRVLWIEGAGMRRPNLGSGADRGKIVRKLLAAMRGAKEVSDFGFRILDLAARGRLWVLSPLLVPLAGIGWIRALNGRLFGRAARRWSNRLGFDRPVLINYVPVLAGAMRGWPGRVVYHCVDRWDQFDMYDTEVMNTMDALCRRYAQLVIASSRDLYEHCRRDHEHVRLVNHGVDHAHFARPCLEEAARPSDLPEGPVVGFIGLLSEWVDQDLLLRLAGELPETHLVLIGKADVPVALREQPNIHLLGPRPYEALPAYVAHFTVGLIPFKVSELTRAVNPIKLREMLAAGCPVVATDLPEVAAYRECGTRNPSSLRYAETRAERGMGRAGVVAADGPESFIAAVKGFVEDPLTADERRILSESMRGETWAAKTAEIVSLVEGSQGSCV